MKIEDIDHQLRDIKVDEKTKKALIKIIDLKTENDMEKILQEMRLSNKMFAKELKIVYWVVGIAMAIMLAILAFKK